MRKEKILEILENAKDGNGAVPMRLVRTAFDKLPEPCEDTISRQAAIDAIDEERKQRHLFNTAEDGLLEARRIINTLTPVQPERKKGEWLPDNNNAYEMRFVCSCCKESEVVPTIGFTKYKPLWDFCPNCGADMRGEKDG